MTSSAATIAFALKPPSDGGQSITTESHFPSDDRSALRSFVSPARPLVVASSGWRLSSAVISEKVRTPVLVGVLRVTSTGWRASGPVRVKRFAAEQPWPPNRDDRLPCGSRSTRSVRRPISDRYHPRWKAREVFPTPPFWLKIEMILKRHPSL
jgi:hypothetical protein